MVAVSCDAGVFEWLSAAGGVVAGNALPEDGSRSTGLPVVVVCTVCARPEAPARVGLGSIVVAAVGCCAVVFVDVAGVAVVLVAGWVT